MPTDIAIPLTRRAQAEARALKDAMINLIIVCVWSGIGLILMALISMFGIDAEVAAMIVTNG